MRIIEIKDVDQLLNDAKYVVAVSSFFKCEKDFAYDVAIMGFSSKKAYNKAFDDWNDGLNRFYYNLRVKDGKVYDEEGRVLIPDWVFNRTTKQMHRRMKGAWA